MNFEEIAKNKLVIFDLDYTIGYLVVDWGTYMDEVSKHEPKTTFEGKENFSPNFHSVEHEPIYELRKEHELSNIENTKLNHTAVDLIKYLFDKKIKMAICSNNLLITIEEFLTHSNMSQYFDYLVGLDTTMKPKPYPDGCNLILNHFKISSKDTLFIGDNHETDKLAAERAGIEFLDVENVSNN